MSINKNITIKNNMRIVRKEICYKVIKVTKNYVTVTLCNEISNFGNTNKIGKPLIYTHFSHF